MGSDLSYAGAIAGAWSTVHNGPTARQGPAIFVEPLEQRTLFAGGLQAVSLVPVSDALAIAQSVQPLAVSRPTLTPTSPAGLSVLVSGGSVTLPSGKSVTVHAGKVSFAQPEIRTDTQVVPTPINYNASMGGPGLSWQSALPLVPAAAQPFRGGLFHAVLAGSVVVKSATGSKTFINGVDYRLNVEWGQVANLGNRLGNPVSSRVKVSYRYATQRLDLVEVLANGTLKVKTGVSAIVTPSLPTPDAGAAALAGIYIYTLDGARSSGFTIQQRDINRIDPAPTVQPINRAMISKTLAKLKAGKSVNIAWFGDSITAGAEVPATRSNRSQTYTGQVIAGLRSKFPAAKITETAAYLGGISAEFQGDIFQKKVLNVHDSGKKIDLLVIALGMNDPAKPLTNFTNPMKSFIARAKARGIEVLLVTTMPWDPIVESRWSFRPKGQIAEATRDLGMSQHVAVADVYKAWMNLPSQGIPVWSQIHNWVQHPGVYGQKLYSETILRVFA